MKTVKIIVLGEGGVGKTSFLNSVIYDTFDENSELTKGVEFHSKEVQMRIHDETYNLVFWDFGGQDRFRKFLDDFVDGSSVAVFVFDTSRYRSLDELETWLDLLDRGKEIPIIILGTKTDILDEYERRSFEEVLSEIVDGFDQIFDYKLISNKTRENVMEAMDSIISKLEETSLKRK